MTQLPSVVRRVCVRLSISLALVIGAAPAAFGQAWVPPGGVGSINVSFQAIANTGHRDHAGTMIRGFDSESQTIAVDFDYAFTDRFSLNVGVPWVAAKYTGPNPSFFGLPIDDCLCWNTSWQDIGVTARYNVVNGIFALTPSVSFGTPTHSYDDIGEAAVGRNLNEMRVAIDAGRRLDEITPRLMVSGRYSYAMVEKAVDGTGTEVPNNRSNGAIEVGYMFSRKLAVRGAFAWQVTHGGIRSNEFNDDNFFLYDRVVRDNYRHLGAGVSYSFPRVDVFLSYVAYMAGTDTHAGRALTIGISLPFER
jgi:hypothetical protein